MMLGRTDSRGRLVLLLVAMLLGSAVLVARLAWWQVARADDLAEAANRQIYLRTEIPADRGTIYDRSGTVILAESVNRQRLVVDASQLDDAAQADLAQIVGDALELDDAGRATIAARLASGKPYVVVTRNLTQDVSDQIKQAAREAKIPAVTSETEAVRTYPQSGGGPDTSLAAHLLGFVNRDGQGQYGVEQYYQSQLAGTPAVVESDRDANGQPIAETEHTVDAGTPGADLSLTIDAGLQLAVEQEVIQAWVADRAKGVSAVVMDPKTGEVLAEASFPSFDGNAYASMAATDPGRFIDPVVSSVYEPGSVFKMFTVIAGLQSGTVGLDTVIDDTGTLKLDDGRTHIDDADRKGMGPMTMEDGIAWSRNVVAAKVALGLAPTTDAAATTLYDEWRTMGFGSPSGIDVAGEVGGIMRDPATTPWREIDLANGAFGQGVAVTPIQLAAAYSAMVNGGTLVSPHVVRAINGVPVPIQDRGSVLDPTLSPTLIGFMNHVVSTVPFYRDRTLIPGYYVGGKTGTAQIWDTAINNWKTGVFDFSFDGFIGRQPGQADLVIAIKIDEGRPTIQRVGEVEMPVMSFELFRRIATDAMAFPGLLPDPADAPVPTQVGE